MFLEKHHVKKRVKCKNRKCKYTEVKKCKQVSGSRKPYSPLRSPAFLYRLFIFKYTKKTDGTIFGPYLIFQWKTNSKKSQVLVLSKSKTKAISMRWKLLFLWVENVPHHPMGPIQFVQHNWLFFRTLLTMDYYASYLLS